MIIETCIICLFSIHDQKKIGSPTYHPAIGVHFDTKEFLFNLRFYILCIKIHSSTVVNIINI